MLIEVIKGLCLDFYALFFVPSSIYSTNGACWSSLTFYPSYHCIALSRRWADLRWKATVSTCVMLKVAVKVSLSRSLFYAVVWLWTQKLKSSLSFTDKKVMVWVRRKLWVLFSSYFAESQMSGCRAFYQITNYGGKNVRQKAAIKPQNIGLKTAAAKRPYFAHCIAISLQIIWIIYSCSIAPL